MRREELSRAIRLSIAGEMEAIFVYDAHVKAIDESIDKKAKSPGDGI